MEKLKSYQKEVWRSAEKELAQLEKSLQNEINHIQYLEEKFSNDVWNGGNAETCKSMVGKYKSDMELCKNCIKEYRIFITNTIASEGVADEKELQKLIQLQQNKRSV